MSVYNWTSNQTRIGKLKKHVLDARKKLNAFGGEWTDLWPLLGRNLSIALRQLRIDFHPGDDRFPAGSLHPRMDVEYL